MTTEQSSDPVATAPLLRPAEAAHRLGIPASTLRRWSRRFAPFLSPEANGLRRPDGARGHRRYTPQDLTILARCKAFLSEGYTFKQVADLLQTTHQPEVLVVEGEIEPTTAEPQTQPQTAPAPSDQAPLDADIELGRLLAKMFSTLSGSQNMLLVGQQTERELLRVLIQDNLNLKEENRRLRERMVETERRIFEIKREMERYRGEDRERMRQMEAYLFQLQRQIDDLVRSKRPFNPQPGAPIVTTPATMQRTSPSPSPPAPSEPSPPPPPEEAPSSPGEETPAARKKRTFWDWLLGR